MSKFVQDQVYRRSQEKLENGTELAEMKIQRGIFKGDDLSTSLFVIEVIPLNHILRKGTESYKFTKYQEKINHLLYMDDIKLFAKNEKETNANNKNIQSGYRNGISYAKREKTENRWKRTTE